MTTVSLTVPTSIPTVQLPPSGQMKKNWILTGSDGVQIQIMKNSDTFYKGDTRVFNSLASSRTLYQFIFPVNTTVSTDTTTYTTPANSIYVFSDNSTATLISSQWIKNVTKGTIQITPAVVDQSSLEDTSIGTLSMVDIAKESPFYSLLLVVYKLAMDMISIFIFWALFISISCWSRIKSEYLYPSNVYEYPFVFYQEKENLYDPMKSQGDEVCSLLTTAQMNLKLSEQKLWFHKLENLNGDVREILDAIYPSILGRNSEGVNALSGYLMNNCSKPDKCTSELIVYFLLKILLNNYLYCNKVLAFIHGLSYLFHENIITSIPSPLSILLFAALLYSLFLGVGAMNDIVMSKFNIQFEKETSISSICLNQFYRLMVTILSCCLSLILPLCSILVVTTLLATAYTVVTTLISGVSATLAVMAFFTLSFSIASYALIGARVGQGMDPFEIIESIFGEPISLTNFFSMFGVILPILMGIGYSFWVGFNLFFSFFKFLKLDKVIETLKSSSASIVLVALVLLMIHVKEILGDTYTMMTFMMIILIGYYVSTLIGK